MGSTAAWLRAVFALALLFGTAFSFEPVTDSSFATYLSPYLDGSTVSVKATFSETSYFSQPKPENYPALNPAATGQFYKPIDISEGYFSTGSQPLQDLPVYFTYDGHPVVAGPCTPAFTGTDGIVNCTILSYEDESGNVVTVESQESCGVVGIEFRGGYSADRTKFYQPSYKSMVFCSPSSKALSTLGTSIYNALASPQNLPFCFPVILLAGLLVSSMYYSGRDPLSLFDLTTPRLPRVRQFRLKSATAPQMMRSMSRRYWIMQMRAERDIINSARMAAKAQADALGYSGAEKRRYVRNFAEQARQVMRDFRVKMRIAGAAKRPVTLTDLEDAKQGLNRIFDQLSPSDKGSNKYKRWKYSRELIEGWLQLHQMAELAGKLTGAARGGDAGGWISRKLGEKVFDPLSKKMVAAEETRAVRAIARVPILSVVVTGPTKTWDALMQFRATRRGAKTVRRNIYGALLYNTLLSRKDRDDPGGRHLTGAGRLMRGMFEKGGGEQTSLGRLANWWNKWTFSDFEKRVDISKRTVNQLFNTAERSRLSDTYSLNHWFKHNFNALYGALPLESMNSPKALREALEADLRAAKGADKAKLRALLEKIAGAAISTEARDKLKSSMDELRKANARLLANTDRFHDRSMEIEGKVLAITEGVRTGRITLADALERMQSLANRYGAAGQGALLNRARIAEFRELEEYVRNNMLAMRDEKNGGFYIPVQFEAIDAERRSRLMRDKATSDAIAQIRRNAGEAAFQRMTAFELQQQLLGSSISPAVRAHVRLVNSEITGRFGDSLARMGKAEYDARLRQTYNDLLRQIGVDANGKDKRETISARLADLGKRINEDAAERITFAGKNDTQIREAERKLQENLLRMSMFGNYPTGFYLTEKLRALGFVDRNNNPYKITNLNELELLYGKGVGKGDFLPQLDAAIRAGAFGSKAQQNLASATSDKELQAVRKAAFDSLAANAGLFARQWESRLWTTASLFSAATKEREGALRDLFGTSATISLLEKINPKQRLEYAIKRADFTSFDHQVSAYGKDVEANVLLARAYDNMAGFIAWRNMRGASWGDDSLGRLHSLLERNTDDVGKIRAMYQNLLDPTSKYYDPAFAARMRGRELNAETFQELVNRGITFADIKRGLPYIVAGDVRGSMPVLEWRKDVLDAQGKTVIVKRGEDIRDLTPILARTQESWFYNLPLGMTILIRHQDRGGNVTWVYGDPNRDPNTSALLNAARSNIDLRKSIGYALSGFDPATGTYNAGMQRIKVVPTQDFKDYAKTNPGNFFGDMGWLDKRREGLRSLYYGAGQTGATFVYTAFSERVEKMQKWWVAQLQIRFALDALRQHAMYNEGTGEGFIVDGNKRFNIKKDDGFDARYGDDAEKVSDAMNLAKRGDDTFTGNLSAGWFNLRRSVASRTVVDIQNAENEWYSAKLELKALDSLMKTHKISDADYARYHADAEARLGDSKTAMKETRKDFKDFNQTVMRWTASHAASQYGSTKSALTMFDVFGKYLDSKWVQGAPDEFFEVAESSAMRDPRSAIGAGPGLDYAFYVLYQTGQNVYERSSFYLINSAWERSLQNKLLPTFGVHKWFNDYMSYAMRKSSAYPAWFEMDPMYPGQPGKRQVSAGFLAPLQSHHHTDYFQARAQSFINYTGIGTLIGSYIMTGSQDPTQRNWFKKTLDWAFTPNSSHYNEHALLRGLQRPLDQFEHFERRMNDIIGHDASYRDAYDRWASAEPGSAEKSEIWNSTFKPLVKVFGGLPSMEDRRPRGVQEAMSGRDIQEDGSRNRFMEMFVGFHSNVWRPVMPAYQDRDPLTDAWRPFSHSAAYVDKESQDERIRAMGSFMLSRYDKDTGIVQPREAFDTHLDAYRDVTKKEQTALLHIAKLQSEYNMYSAINSPVMWFFNPVVAAAVHGIGVPFTKAGSALSVTDRFGPHGLRLGVYPALSAADSKLSSNLEGGGGEAPPNYVYGRGSMPDYDGFVQQVTGHSASEFSGRGGGAGSAMHASWMAQRAMMIRERLGGWYDYAARARMEAWMPLLGRRKREDLEETWKLSEKLKGGV